MWIMYSSLSLSFSHYFHVIDHICLKYWVIFKNTLWIIHCQWSSRGVGCFSFPFPMEFKCYHNVCDNIIPMNMWRPDFHMTNYGEQAQRNVSSSVWEWNRNRRFASNGNKWKSRHLKFIQQWMMFFYFQQTIRSVTEWEIFCRFCPSSSSSTSLMMVTVKWSEMNWIEFIKMSNSCFMVSPKWGVFM